MGSSYTKRTPTQLRAWRRRSMRGGRRQALVHPMSWNSSQFTGGGTVIGGVSGGYDITDPQRTVVEPIRAAFASLNALLNLDLRTLVAVLRQLERNNATIRAMVEAYKARVVGTGISVIPDTGNDEWNDRLSEQIEQQFRNIGVAGESAMELQQVWVADLCTAGNALGRLVTIEDRVDDDLVPLAVLGYEAEWILHEQPVRPAADGHRIIAGVEGDRYSRPVAYHLRDPDASESGEVVDARYMLHAFERRRMRQIVGEPILVAIIERALQRGRLIDSELKSAINASVLSTYTKSMSHPEPIDSNDYDSDGQATYIQEFRLGTHSRLGPDEDVGMVQGSRPNTDVASFASGLNGDIAGAGGVSRVDLDRNGADYNHSNARFDQIHSNARTKPLQTWFGRRTLGKVYEAQLPYLCLRAGIMWPADDRRRQAQLRRYRIQPDIMPEQDEKGMAQAFEILRRTRGMTLEEWYGRRGRDWRKEVEQMAKEEQVLRDANLMAIDTAVAAVPAAAGEEDE